LFIDFCFFFESQNDEKFNQSQNAENDQKIKLIINRKLFIIENLIEIISVEFSIAIFFKFFIAEEFFVQSFSEFPEFEREYEIPVETGFDFEVVFVDVVEVFAQKAEFEVHAAGIRRIQTGEFDAEDVLDGFEHGTDVVVVEGVDDHFRVEFGVGVVFDSESNVFFHAVAHVVHDFFEQARAVREAQFAVAREVVKVVEFERFVGVVQQVENVYVRLFENVECFVVDQTVHDRVGKKLNVSVVEEVFFALRVGYVQYFTELFAECRVEY
jgi:hypothetical protein